MLLYEVQLYFIQEVVCNTQKIILNLKAVIIIVSYLSSLYRHLKTTDYTKCLETLINFSHIFAIYLKPEK